MRQITVLRNQVAWLACIGVAVILGLAAAGCDLQSEATSSAQPDASLSRAAVELVPLTNMLPIKAGTYTRFSKGVTNQVTISRDFWIGRYEVTQGEYVSVMGHNPSHFHGDARRPVEKVTYFAAVKYCEAVTQKERAAARLPAGFRYRLPTEAEWEYAARAGTTNVFNFNGGLEEAGKFAWTLENSDGSTHPVGQKLPNPWGLYDTHGNVWEWCSDWLIEFPNVPLTDPVGPSTGKFKVFRGGGWNQTAEFARLPNRFMMSPSNGIYFVGFRLALGKVQSKAPTP